jgi:hypothetical protein
MIALEDQDTTSMVSAAIKRVSCGIAPHQDGRETDEYRRNVPVWLRHRNGLPADQIASILAVDAPELGIESENDLYQALNAGQWQRRNQTAGNYKPAKPEGKRPMATKAATPKAAPVSGFDPEEATTAVHEFACILETLDAATVSAIRQAWKESYLRCGHKALARYLMSGDMDKATKKFKVVD